MSAIVGLLGLDGKPAESDVLARMVDTMAHRGPDGRAVWCKGQVGLGHCMLHTTPESLHERLPLQIADLTITADARIDNREELIRLLQLGNEQQEDLSDSELLLQAYRKWGEACLERLVGDFAFAIWDRLRKELFCARDPLGVRSLYYFHSSRLFVFATEIKGVLAAPGVPRELDELRLGFHLVPTVEDNSITFYRGVRRLPPGHTLMVDQQGLRCRPYWSLDSTRNVSLPAEDDYVQAFREVFHEAVRCRLRSAFPVGSTLSGGLDSSSVTCVARNFLSEAGNAPLHTFSAVFDKTPQCDERRYIGAALGQGGLQPHYMMADSLSPFDDLGEQFATMDEPVSSPTLYLYSNLCRAARKGGMRVLLDGFDGDSAVHHGDSYLAEIARAGDWKRFASEARTISRHEGLASLPSLIDQYGSPYLTELALSGKFGTFAREARGFARAFGLNRRKVYWHCAIAPGFLAPMRRLTGQLAQRDGARNGVGRLIQRGFARRIGLEERLKTLAGNRPGTVRTAREEHVAILNSGLLPYAFECLDKASMAFGIEGRHPYADRRLVELCVSMPAQHKLEQGWTRMVVRRALSDVLPHEIAWRGGKTVNSPAVSAAFDRVKSTVLRDAIIEAPGSLGAYVDLCELREIYRRYLDGGGLQAELLLWQSATLSLWLRHTGLGG